jgi:hypothetical protein
MACEDDFSTFFTQVIQDFEVWGMGDTDNKIRVFLD